MQPLDIGKIDWNSESERLRHEFPYLSDLDIHYLGLKCYGVRDEKHNKGRPTWNLTDPDNMYHITFGTTEGDSPFSIEGHIILVGKQSLPLRTDFIERVPVTVGRYHYFRHANYMTPSLDNETILNVNFQRQCAACEFCQYKLYLSQPNVSVGVGFDDIMSREEIDDLSHVGQIAVVTGLFGSENAASEHIGQVAARASREGFGGSIFYIGFEIQSEEAITKLIERIRREGLKGLEMAYTVEMFEDRQRLMRSYKSHQTLEEVRQTLERLKHTGVENLQYTYMPGLDDLNNFMKGAELLAPLAKPHISIFRPWKRYQRNRQASEDYKNLGAYYLCYARTFYEQLYGEEMYGNNLGNLWPFPLDRVDRRWLAEEIEGPELGRRYWKGKKDPRNRDVAED